MAFFTISSGSASAKISELGAWLIEYTIDSKDVLFQGIEYEKDGVIKRRGGIPLLFPNAGKKIKFENIELNQHGFARDMMWKKVEQKEDELILRLIDNTDSFKIFPFHFQAEVSFKINQDFLTLSLVVLNSDSVSIPLAPGFHPYFNLVKADRAKFVCPVQAFKFNGDTTYVNSKSPVRFSVPVGNILLEFSDNFKNLSYWSESEADYICIEPWVGVEGTMLNNLERVNLMPQKSARFWVKIRIN